MPGGDGTGPVGMGPMTGRAAGFCAGYDMPGYANPVGGRGFWGRGARGGGRGWRNQFFASGMTGWQRAALGLGAAWGAHWLLRRGAPAPYGVAPTREQEMEALKAQAENLQDTLESIQKRMADLQSEAAEK